MKLSVGRLMGKPYKGGVRLWPSEPITQFSFTQRGTSGQHLLPEGAQEETKSIWEGILSPPPPTSLTQWNLNLIKPSGLITGNTRDGGKKLNDTLRKKQMNPESGTFYRTNEHISV